MALISLAAFAQTTREIVMEEGFADYCPTLYHEEDLVVVEGIPDGVDHRDALQRMIRRQGLVGKEFMFGVLSGPDEVMTGHVGPGGATFMAVRMVEGEVRVHEHPRPAWWQPED